MLFKQTMLNETEQSTEESFHELEVIGIKISNGTVADCHEKIWALFGYKKEIEEAKTRKLNEIAYLIKGTHSVSFFHLHSDLIFFPNWINLNDGEEACLCTYPTQNNNEYDFN